MKVISYTFCKTCGTEEVFNIGDVKKPNMEEVKKARDSALKHANHVMFNVTISYEQPEDIKEFLDKRILTKELLDKF